MKRSKKEKVRRLDGMGGLKRNANPKVISHVIAALFTRRQNTTANVAHVDKDTTSGSRTQWQQWKLGWQKCAGGCPGSLISRC